MDYDTYPMTMAHPLFKKAQSLPVPGSQTFNTKGEVVHQAYQGTAEQFPPVTVANETEEEYYKAQGYQRAGHVDPAAYVQQHASPPPVDYSPAEYPKWVLGQLVGSAEEEAELVQLAARAPVVEAASPYYAPEETIESLEARLKAMKAAAPKNRGGRPRKVQPEHHEAL